MKQFYHLYVVLNNVEDIEILDIEEIQAIDNYFSRILDDIKQSPKQEIIDNIIAQVEELL